MAVYLAEKLGPKGLQAYCLDPGVVLGTSLLKDLDLEADVASISMCYVSISISTS